MSIIVAAKPSSRKRFRRGVAEMEKLPINPMQRVSKMLAAPRCLARTRRGTACQSPAVKGRKRCRMHGGTNPGAPKGNSNALKHGMNAANAIEDRRRLRTLLREARSEEHTSELKSLMRISYA